MTETAIIEYCPRKQFRKFHNTTKRFGVSVAHRRSGKTVAGVAKAIQKAFECQRQNPRTGVVLPYLKQAKTNAWQYLKQMTRHLPERSVNESELKITMIGNREVRLYGADNPNSIRGGYFDYVFCDEWAFADPTVYPLVIRPMLSDRMGSIDFASTPNGKNHFHTLYKQACQEKKYFTMFLEAETSGLLRADELADIKADPLISEEKYAQEYLCSFEAATEGSYYGVLIARAASEGRIRGGIYNPLLPVVTVWDIGESDDTVIWFAQWSPDGLNVVNLYKNNGQTIAHYCDIIKTMGYAYVAHYLPHDIEQKHFGMLKTRREQFKENGIDVITVPRMVSKMDGINAARTVLPICRFDETKCSYGIEALKAYHAEFDFDRMVFKDTPVHDWSSHPADAFANMALVYNSIFRRSQPKPVETLPGIDVSMPTFSDFLKTDSGYDDERRRI